jgi:glycosyltransferase involved in cell wall biosynthesis
LTPAPRILYVNQTGRMSGGERSLIDLLDALNGRVDPVVACPDGELARELARRSIPVKSLPEARFSFRLHPVHTPRGAAWIGVTGLRVRRLVKTLGIDLVHANSARAGLASWAVGVGRTPVLVHMRDWFPNGVAARATVASLEATADLVVANSQFVADQMSGRAGSVVVLHNPINADRFDPGKHPREPARTALGLSRDDEVLAMVAHFVPWKGQMDAVHAMAILKEARPRAKLLVVGSAKFTGRGERHDSEAFEREVRGLVDASGLEDRVVFLGERSDVPTVLAASDLLLAPSWKEAFGRTVLEGMASGIPVVATRIGGPAEVIRDGEDGVLLEPREPEVWARTIARLLDDPALRRTIGVAARSRVVDDFRPAQYADDVLSLYSDLIHGRAGGGSEG